MREKVKEYFSDNRRTAITVFAVIAVIVLIIGLCLSWFVENKRLETVGEIAGPSVIKVMGPNATGLEELDLAYEPTEFPNHEVKLTRAFSVVSGSSFRLYLAHTTNISNLNIALYRVNDVTGTSDEKSADISQLDSDGTKYAWKKKGENLYPEKGKYINGKEGADPKLAEDLNGQIFDGAEVQENAIPLYWEIYVNNTDGETSKYQDEDGKNCHLTNFIIDLSWTDSAKETDVLYLIAKN